MIDMTSFPIHIRIEPKFGIGERVWLIHDMAFGVIEAKGIAEGSSQWFYDLCVDGRKIGPRLERELERPALKVVK
jgi:hypothetical protein